MRRITLYTKPGCTLCQPVRETILKAARQRSFDFVSRNILEDPADFERYKFAIPVVTVDDVEVARYRLALQQLLDALDGP